MTVRNSAIFSCDSGFISFDYLLSDTVIPRNEALNSLWLQLMGERTEAEKLLAINMIKMMYSYLDENKNVMNPVQESYYLLNTNVSNCIDDDTDMLLNHKAAAYNTTKFAIKRIRKGDRVFLYRSGVGIVAMGIGSGELKIKNYHNDPNLEDEEYYTPLNDFNKLGKPLSASDMKKVTNTNYNFVGTLSEINSQDGIRLWKYMHANCI